MPDTPSTANKHPAYWGLTLAFHPDAHVLVVEDQIEKRKPILQRLLAGCHVTWASTALEVQQALDQHGPFDMYCLDFDLGEEKGGWTPSGQLIRQRDPRSIAKVVLIHSANPDARAYFDIFPAGIFIQWYVLATILGVPILDNQLIDSINALVNKNANEDQLKQAFLSLKPHGLTENSNEQK